MTEEAAASSADIAASNVHAELRALRFEAFGRQRAANIERIETFQDFTLRDKPGPIREAVNQKHVTATRSILRLRF